MKKLKTLSITIAAVALFAACATHGPKQQSAAGAQLQSTSGSVTQAVAQIDVATAALTELVEKPGADLKLQFKNFSSAVSSLESAARNVGSRATKAQQIGASYFQQWDEQLAKIQNEEIRNNSAERKAAVMKQFDKAKATYDEARTAFNPLLANLRDIRTAIGADLTPAGVEAIRKSMTKVNEQAATVRKSLLDLAAQFKELGKSLEVPTVPPPAKAASAGKSEPAAK